MKYMKLIQELSAFNQCRIRRNTHRITINMHSIGNINSTLAYFQINTLNVNRGLNLPIIILVFPQTRFVDFSVSQLKYRTPLTAIKPAF